MVLGIPKVREADLTRLWNLYEIPMNHYKIHISSKKQRLVENECINIFVLNSTFFSYLLFQDNVHDPVSRLDDRRCISNVRELLLNGLDLLIVLPLQELQLCLLGPKLHFQNLVG